MKSIFIHFPDNIDSWSFIVELVVDDKIIWSDVADTLEECFDIIKEHV